MVVAVSGSDFRDRYVDMKRRQRAEEDEMNMTEAKRMADAGGEEIITPENLGKAAAVAGAAVLGVLGANRLRKGLSNPYRGQKTPEGFSDTFRKAARGESTNLLPSAPANRPGLDAGSVNVNPDYQMPEQVLRRRTPSEAPRAANEGVRQVNISELTAQVPDSPQDFQGVRPDVGKRMDVGTSQDLRQARRESFTEGVGEAGRAQALQMELKAEGMPTAVDQLRYRGNLEAPGTLEYQPESRPLSATPEQRSLDFEAGRAQGVREVKEELGGQVLDQLQPKGKASDSFAQGYVRKEGYVDSSPVQTQSTDSMDIDGYQEHREVKRVLQRNEDLDIGAITAKSEPDFGAANPEQVDNSTERIAARVQETPIRERSGGGFNQETTFDQMEQNVDPQGFTKEYITRLPSAADNPSVQKDYSKGLYTKYTDTEGEKTFQRGQERRMDAQDESTVLRRGGDVFGPLKNEPPVPEVLSETRSMDNIGQSNIDPAKAPIDTSPSDTSIRGRSRVQNVPEQFTDAGEYVLDQYDPDPASKPRTEFRIAGVKGAQGPISRDVMMKAQSTQGPLAAEQMREMAAKRQPPSKELTYDKDPGGVGIYGVERQFASGPLAKQDQYNKKGELTRQAGDYTRAASMNPTTVFPDARGGESNPRQFQVAPDYVRMDDDTLASAKQRAAGPMQQKLGAEMDRRKVAKSSATASDRILEINRNNPPERAKQMVSDYLNQLRGGV